MDRSAQADEEITGCGLFTSSRTAWADDDRQMWERELVRANGAELDQLCKHLGDELGERVGWEPWPGGWSDGIETALVDAVFSARAQCRSRNGKGVHSLVTAWRAGRSTTERDSLRVLEEEIGPDHTSAASWSTAFGSMSPAPSRRSRRPDDPLKAAADREASRGLLAIGVEHAGDVIVDGLHRVLSERRRCQASATQPPHTSSCFSDSPA